MTLAQPPLWLILIAFIGMLGPLVTIHELGHYWVGRWFGIGAETFSIGFGREIFGWTDKRGTRWKVAWLPLGGYVKFAGDRNEASQPSSSEEVTVAPGVIGEPFQTQAVWKRFLVVLAGPMANFLLAIAIFAAFFMAFGMPRSSNVVGSVVEDSVASRADIQPGDRIVEIDGREMDSFSDVRMMVTMRPGMTVEMVRLRGQDRIVSDVTFDKVVETDEFGQEYNIGRLGVASAELAYERVGPLAAFPIATRQVFAVTRSMIDGLGQIIVGDRSAKELGGPVKVAQVAGQQLSLGLLTFVQLIALFSINLGFINLLPVPMLDGGHLMLYTIEAVRRRPVSEQVQEWAFRGGFALLMSVILLMTINDLGSVGLIDGFQRLIG